MPLQRYGVLKGAAVEARRDDGLYTPHVQVRVHAGETPFRIAINVLSSGRPSELLFRIDRAFQHPLTSRLAALPTGFTQVPSESNGLALDYIRGKLVTRASMHALPASRPGPNNDLSDAVERYVNRAILEAGATIYAFGECWGPEQKPDKVFGFAPGNGIRGIHMNQGNALEFRRDDGVWQDGGVIIHFPITDQWVSIFLAFQSQAWRTDNHTGHARVHSFVPDLRA
jgi:uncharacterized protein YukJ